jgi:hypothetical protein
MVTTVEGKEGKIYTLYQNKKNPNLRFFASKKPKPGNQKIDMPAGYKIVKNKRTGLPMLKKK